LNFIAIQVVDAKTISGNCHKTANSTLKHKTRSIKDDPDVKAKKIIKKRAVSAPHYQPSVSPDSGTGTVSIICCYTWLQVQLLSRSF